MVPNISVSLQTTAAAQEHLANGQFLLTADAEHKLCDILSKNERTNSFQKRTEFKINKILNKERCIKVISLLSQGVQF
jgi:hypothetical protein